MAATSVSTRTLPCSSTTSATRAAPQPHEDRLPRTGGPVMARGVAASLPTRVPDIRKGDTVVVLTGRDAGKRGVVDRVMRRRPNPYGRGTRVRPDAATLSDAAVVIDGIHMA